VSLVVTSFAQHYSRDQGGDTRVDVHYRASGKVQSPQFKEPSVSRPYPVGHRVVHQQGPENREEQETLEPDSFGKRTQNQGRSDDRKHTLKHDEQQMGNGTHRSPVRSGLAVRDEVWAQIGYRYSLQEGPVEPSDKGSQCP